MIRLLRFSDSDYCPLKQNMLHQFAQRHALCHYHSQSVYSFIPKNACSTMRVSLAIANGCIQSVDNFNWIHKNNDTFSASLADLAQAKYTFTILRCPFSRLASVYLDKIVSRTPVYWEYWDLTKRQADMEGLTFRGFVKSLERPAIAKGNIHWRSQVDFLVYRNYDDYFCVEDFPRAQAKLKAVIGLEIADARSLTKHGIDGYDLKSNNNYTDVPVPKLLAMKAEGALPHPRALYDQELIAAAAKIFQNDIALYKEAIGPGRLLFDA